MMTNETTVVDRFRVHELPTGLDAKAVEVVGELVGEAARVTVAMVAENDAVVPAVEKYQFRRGAIAQLPWASVLTDGLAVNAIWSMSQVTALANSETFIRPWETMRDRLARV